MTLLPPVQYDVPPARPVIERVLPYAQVWRTCSAWNEQMGLKGWGEVRELKGYEPGCTALTVDGKCFIVRVDGDKVRRHELGHCNGWPQSHEGGREK